MPIRPFLEGDVFEQDLIEIMSQALADACRELQLRDKEDAAVRLLAKRIIDAAKQGIHERDLLKAAAVEGFGPPRRH